MVCLNFDTCRSGLPRLHLMDCLQNFAAVEVLAVFAKLQLHFKPFFMCEVVLFVFMELSFFLITSLIASN